MLELLNKLEKQLISVDGNLYEVFVNRQITERPESLKLLVVSYLLNEFNREILDVCLKSIQKYTSEEHELWVIHNNSPPKSIKCFAIVKD